MGDDVGADESTAKNTTLSAGIERHYKGTPHTIGLDISASKRSGGYENGPDKTQISSSLNYQYSFGGSYDTNSKKRVRVEVPQNAWTKRALHNDIKNNISVNTYQTAETIPLSSKELESNKLSRRGMRYERGTRARNDSYTVDHNKLKDGTFFAAAHSNDVGFGRYIGAGKAKNGQTSYNNKISHRTRDGKEVFTGRFIIAYKPNPSFIGKERFKYYIRGKNGQQSSAFITVDVINSGNKSPTTADLNGDGRINQADVDLFKVYFNNQDLRGDYNGDGRMSTQDLAIFKKLYDETNPPSKPKQPTTADLNDDGRVNQADRDLFKVYFNNQDLRGDYNGDGRMSTQDLAIFKKLYDEANPPSKPKQPTTADLNGDGRVNQADRDLFKVYFNNQDLRGDYNGDDRMSTQDLAIFKKLYDEANPPSKPKQPTTADLNGDGRVNKADRDLFKAYFNSQDLRGDYNGDGRVSTQDLAIFKKLYNNTDKPKPPTTYQKSADLNGDGKVSYADWALFNRYSNRGDMRADFNGDGRVDSKDSQAYIAAYNSQR